MTFTQIATDVGIKAGEVGIPTVQANSATFNAIVGLIYAVIGALCLFYIVRAGLLFVSSGSDPSSVKAARETLLYAVIGLLGSTVVFAVVQFVIGSIG